MVSAHRAFATSSAPVGGEAAKEEKKETTDEEKQGVHQNNVYANQHILYVPKTPLKFHTRTPDGTIAEVFRGNPAEHHKAHTWKTTLAGSMVGMAFAKYTLAAATFPLVAPIMLIPTVYYAYDGFKVRNRFKNQIERLWVYRNGDQLLMQTYDGVLHKANIIDNRAYKIEDSKNGLDFVMINSGRNFMVSNKNAPLIDYDLVDRLIRGICVDTLRSQKVFHHLLSKQ